jgi:hypothetical protein
MTETIRLKDLLSYKILDTLPEKELDEIVEIASAILDTPIALVSLIDESRVWFKSKKGLKATENNRQDSFCRHSLVAPNEFLLIEDSLNDERTKDNPLVLGDPKIRFYAGAPLISQGGNLLGLLCVIDIKPRVMSKSQQNALKLLAKKVMDFMNQRKELVEQREKLALNKNHLTKLTQQVPSFFVHIEIDKMGAISMPFVSEGIVNAHPKLNAEALKKDPKVVFDIIYEEDKPVFIDSIAKAFKSNSIWEQEFRMDGENGTIQWYLGKAVSEEKGDGTMVWYATFQNINLKKDYENALEDILFYISHVLRKPVANLLTIAAVVEKEKNIDEESLKLYSGYIKSASNELDSYTRILNKDYFDRKIKL